MIFLFFLNDHVLNLIDDVDVFDGWENPCFRVWTILINWVWLTFDSFDRKGSKSVTSRWRFSLSRWKWMRGGQRDESRRNKNFEIKGTFAPFRSFGFDLVKFGNWSGVRAILELIAWIFIFERSRHSEFVNIYWVNLSHRSFWDYLKIGLDSWSELSLIVDRSIL